MSTVGNESLRPLAAEVKSRLGRVMDSLTSETNARVG
jgi:hypothetical protein